jgi:hypothetical protein
MKIGEILEKLYKCRPDAPVVFDFCGCVPYDVTSWRGSYDTPALGWTKDGSVTVADLISKLKCAISGVKYQGYKGGQYTYGLDHELYVDNYGEYTETVITKVKNKGHFVVLKTKRTDFQ